ncbi:hypothetical protein [Priestia abyssalis]|uniref:hypothetical protein n=1 Tax=Priestia abyssalis TaxID=1221450 RepID=UPI0009957D55|nr:hypothetical protein [Priestia abyssalis]
MEVLTVTPEKHHTYIFVSFPGVKLNVSDKFRKGGGQPLALCVQLDENEEMHDVYFVPEKSISPFDFSSDENGSKALYRVFQAERIKKGNGKQPLQSFSITDEVVILQRKSKKGIEFVLVIKEKEIAALGERRKEGSSLQDTVKQEFVLFHVRPAKEKGRKLFQQEGNSKRVPQKGISRGEKGGFAFRFEEEFGIKTLNKLQYGGSRTSGFQSFAALRFLGPGDQFFPLPRAEPLNL